MKITSPVFKNGEIVPKKYTCEGENISPPLLFEEIPERAKSLALIVEDRDAPNGTWYHWFIFNIPSDVEKIDEGVKPPGIEGHANGGTPGYEGPCPPDPKDHAYHFRLLALDNHFDIPRATDSQQFEELTKGHVIEETELIGIYAGPAKRLKPL